MFSIILRILVGAAVGALIGTAIYMVHERITLKNIAEIIRGALTNSSEAAAKKMLSSAITATIKAKNINVISISALDSTGENEMDIEIEGTSVADDIRVGMVVYA